MIFVSIFPFSLAMTGMHEPHDALRVSSMNDLADNEAAVVHGGVPLPNRVPRNASPLTVLTSLLISLGAAFLVVRCFIALKSRIDEHQYAINSQRLAFDRGEDCPVSIRTKVPDARLLSWWEE